MNSQPHAGSAALLFEALAESFKHFLHVATLHHGDDPHVVLIHPDGEALCVVSDARSIWQSQAIPA